MKKQKTVNRRDFLLRSATALLSTSLLASQSFAVTPPAKYKMGLQLFTVRGPLARDVVGTVKKIFIHRV